MKIPMSSPDISPLDVEAVKQVLGSAWLSIGPRIAKFEEQFAVYMGTRQAIGVSSGTAGLHLSVIASGVGEGDLVITTPFSFVASANVILYERAIPIFVDIEPHTLNIDPVQVAEAVEDLVRSRPCAARWLPPSLRDHLSSKFRPPSSILSIHAFGQPAEMDPILKVAREHDLSVIEDACEAVGAEYKGRKVGTLGDSGVFGFYPNKQMTTGEGGMIVTDREDWDGLFRSLRNQGRDVFDAWLSHSRLGYNYRLDEMSAALGLAQLARIDELLAKREQVALWYNERLSGVDGMKVPYIAPTTTRTSWFVYLIRLAPRIDRNAIMGALEEKGIPSRPYFTPIHLQPFYRERFAYKEGDFPVTESVARSTLALPFFSTMSEEQVDYVCDHILEVLRTPAVRD
ncbi:DegT/DnrJ/EryC1/StrS family aminotransferase [Acidobacteria bacterium AH-259-A15]|nr:DegT/DnrJ/EryC1/StrS family aminotransferase [Acidobacteria bacterium AH-259-A15]